MMGLDWMIRQSQPVRDSSPENMDKALLLARSKFRARLNFRACMLEQTMLTMRCLKNKLAISITRETRSEDLTSVTTSSIY